MIRRQIEPVLLGLADKYPVVTVTGPRQSGKTTLCRQVFPDKAYVSLEDPDTRRYARDDPRGFLAAYREGAVLDEIQRTPDLVSYLQGEVDRDDRPGRFILAGSQQFEVMSTISQSLAGRTAMLRLLPFSFNEVAEYGPLDDLEVLLHRGFFPRIHERDLDPTQALGDYLETYVERDLRQLAQVRDLASFETFLRLCAGRVGQLLNMHSLANDVGVSHSTIRAWITLLEASYIVFLLRPWHANLGKRLVKAPKLYFYDVGLASYLLGIERPGYLRSHPLRGNLFENLVVAEVLKYRYNRGRRSNLYFFRDSVGNEVDLLMEFGNGVFAMEIKAGSTVNPDYFKGLERFSRLAVDLPWGGVVVYSGSATQARRRWPVYPVQALDVVMNGAGKEAR